MDTLSAPTYFVCGGHPDHILVCGLRESSARTAIASPSSATRCEGTGSTSDTRNVTTSREARTLQNAQELIGSTSGVVDATASLAIPFDTDCDASLRYVIEGRALDGPYHGVGDWRPVRRMPVRRESENCQRWNTCRIAAPERAPRLRRPNPC